MRSDVAVLERLTLGWAAASVMQGVHSLFFLGVGASTSPSFLLSHYIVTLIVNVPVALALCGVRGNRPWAACLFFLPTALALLPVVQGYGGSRGLVVLLGLTLLSIEAWSFLPPTSGAPFAAAAIGAAVGAYLVRFELVTFRGLLATDPRDLARAAVLAGAGLMVAWLSGRLSPLVTPRRLGASAVVASCGLAVACGAGLLAWVPRPAVPSAETRAGRRLPSIVFVVLDTVRADHLRRYGYERDTMPRLERFAQREAVGVANAVANSSWTTPSHGSFFTGLYPPHHHAGFGHPFEPRPLRPDVPTLAQLLAATGYWTVAIGANSTGLSPATGLSRGFDVYDMAAPAEDQMKRASPWCAFYPGHEPLVGLDRFWPFSASHFFESWSRYRSAEWVTTAAIAALDAAQERPLFLFVNYMDAHWPLNPPEAFRSAFQAPPLEEATPGWWETFSDSVLSGAHEVSPSERRRLEALYDASLAYLDSELERLIRTVEHDPRWSDAVVVITSDHGECFGEHGFIGHARRLHEGLLRVPLFIKLRPAIPGTPEPGQMLPGPVQSADLMPTILEAAGLSIPRGIDGVAWGRGRSKAVAWADPDGISRIFPSRFARRLRSIEVEGWKLVESAPGGVELFDLESDPQEMRNLADRETERVARLRAALGPPEPIVTHTRATGGPAEAEVGALGYVR